MASTNTQRVREIFEEAIELAEAERQAFLELACAEDSQLRSAVDRLIEAYVEDGCDNSKTDLQSHERPHSSIKGKIGRFRILQKIGEGGFGEVWMAEQLEPVKRRVAIKIIKPGMDSKQVIARFEAERQALAIMEHPNIARVYDGGETEEGRPYFVMELVSGEAISTYCASKHLDIPQRIELFRSVCAAVQHAHQKGIIHRDLKPSNVLVCEVNGKPVAKVIDFGIAKALERPLTDKTLFTEFQQMVGTPAYMSPEQASLSMIDVDTRSDVYSLGVLLYELLAGGPPFDPKSLRSAGFDEMRRIIREVEPPAPSVRLSGERTASDTDDLKSEADRDQRQRKVRGELDWIVQRAMAKERDRRYSSASEFDDDLERYLNGDAVRAGPAGKWYRARRFMARNRVPLAVGGSVAAAIVVAAILLAVGLVVLNKNYQQLQVAESKEREANTQLTTSLEETLQAKEAAVRAYAQTAAANKSLEKQLDVQRVMRASTQTPENWEVARTELDKVNDSERTWLWRMLDAQRPRDVTDQYPELASGYEQLKGREDQRNVEILELAPAAKRAIVAYTEDYVHIKPNTPRVVELISLESNPSAPVVLGTYNDFVQEELPFTSYELGVDRRDNIGLQSGFCGDGSRVIVPPVFCAHAPSINCIRSDNDGSSFPVPANTHIQIYSSDTGVLLAEIPLPKEFPADATPAELQQKLMTLNWATNVNGTRLVVAMERLLQVVDVSTGEVIRQHQLEDGPEVFSWVVMSPSGNQVAAQIRKPTKGRYDISGKPSNNIVWLTTDESQSFPLLFDVGGTPRAIGFTNDEHLLVSSFHEDNKQNAQIELNAFKDGEKIGPGHWRDHLDFYVNRFLPSSSPSNVLVLTPEEIRHVNLQDDRDWGDVPRIEVGERSVSVVEPPRENDPGTILVFKSEPNSLARDLTLKVLEFAKPMAQVVHGGHGMAPSDATYTINYDVEKDFSRELSSSEGKQQFNSVESVSPDSRYVLFDYSDNPSIADLRDDKRYLLEIPKSLRNFRGRSIDQRGAPWADLDGVPILVDVGAPEVLKSLWGGFRNSGTEFLIRTFDVRDGTLMSSMKVSVYDAIEALGLSASILGHQPEFYIHGSAISPHGRFVAISGTFGENGGHNAALGKAKDGLSICMIVERESGNVINAQSLEKIASDLVFAHDENQLAYFLSSDTLKPLIRGHIHFMNAIDAGTETIHPGIEAAYKPNIFDMNPNRMSFSTDGKLLSFACANHVDLYDVDTATFLTRLDWKRITDMLVTDPTQNNGVVNYSRIHRLPEMSCSGAAFSSNGKELRLNVSPMLGGFEIGMIRIFDHSILDSQVHSTAAKDAVDGQDTSVATAQADTTNDE